METFIKDIKETIQAAQVCDRGKQPEPLLEQEGKRERERTIQSNTYNLCDLAISV